MCKTGLGLGWVWQVAQGGDPGTGRATEGRRTHLVEALAELPLPDVEQAQKRGCGSLVG